MVPQHFNCSTRTLLAARSFTNGAPSPPGSTLRPGCSTRPLTPRSTEHHAQKRNGVSRWEKTPNAYRQAGPLAGVPPQHRIVPA
jgi:hypothetical protein